MRQSASSERQGWWLGFIHYRWISPKCSPPVSGVLSFSWPLKDKSHSHLFSPSLTHMGCKCNIKTAGWVMEEPKFQWWIKLKWPTLSLIDKILLQHINGLHWLLIWSFSSEAEPSTQTTHCVNYAIASLSNRTELISCDNAVNSVQHKLLLLWSLY